MRWLILVALASPLVVAQDGGVKNQLISHAKVNNGLIQLDSKTFELLTSPDRDWSATIQLTALGKSFKCEPCKMFDPTFKTVASAWTKAPPAERDQHFFASLDFENGSDIFRKLGLSSAPFIYTFPPSRGPRAPKNGKTDPVPFDFSSTGFDAPSMVEAINRHTPIPIPYKPPVNWTPILTFGTLVLVSAAGAKFVLPILFNKWLWALISIGTSLTMISGFMFVRIRGNPYVAAGRDGRAQWIAGGAQNQFGMETQVVAFIYGLLSFSCISFVLLVPRIPSKVRQTAAIYVWCGVSTLVFAVLLSFFRLKSPWYPYSLFL